MRSAERIVERAPGSAGVPDHAVHSVCTLPAEFDAGSGLEDNRVPQHRAPAKRRIELAIKRGFDVVASACLLLVGAVPLIAVAIAIKLTSRGPALFSQRRYGLNNTIFQILKFRTMYVSEMDQSGVKQTRTDDPRITRLGRFLRRTNLDELPQLLNVLRGDMSLVGPRPHVPGMLAAGVPYEIMAPRYFERHRMRPGITGLAQASQLRGSTCDGKFAKARIEYDLAYIEHWSLLLDLRILWITMKTELRRSTGT